jgi:hypothetical protein
LGFTGGLIAGLAARIPHKVAMEMILLCRILDPQRAYAIDPSRKSATFKHNLARLLIRSRP